VRVAADIASGIKMVGMKEAEALETEMDCHLDVFVSLTYSEQKQKYGRIPTIVRRAWYISGSCLTPSVMGQLSCGLHAAGSYLQLIGAPAACSCQLLSATRSPVLSWI